MALANLIVRIGADIADYDRKIGAAERRMQTFASNVSSVGASLTAAISVPLLGIGVAALKVAGDLEQNRIAFETMMGSAAKAQQHLEALKQFAAKTPFEFSELVLASKRLQALGFDGQRVIPILTSVGNAASALGLGAEGIQRITTALGQMQAKGKVQAEEMRQLAEAGIPAWQILAKTLNTDVAGAMKLVEKRAVDAAVAVPALLEGMNTKFGGLMEKQATTLLGMWSNFKDQTYFALQDIGDALAPAAKRFLDEYAFPVLEAAKKVTAAFKGLHPETQQTVLGMGMIAVATPIAILALGTLAEKGLALWQVLGKLRGILPIVGAGIGPLGIAMGFVATKTGDIYKAWQKLKDEWQNDQFLNAIRGKSLYLEASLKGINQQLMAATMNDMAPLVNQMYNLDGSVKKTAESTATLTLKTAELTEAQKRKTEAAYKSATALMVKVDAAHASTRAEQSLKAAIGSTIEEIRAQTQALYLKQFAGVVAAQDVAKAQERMKSVIAGATAEIKKQMDGFKALDDAVEAFRRDQLKGIEDAMGGRNMDATLDKTAKKNADTAKSIETVWERAGRQISTITTDLGKNITDLIFAGGKLKDVLASTFSEIGKSLVRSAIEAQIRRVTTAILDLISKSGILGKVLGSIFGGGASAAAGGIGQAAGGAAGAAGSIGGGVASAGASAASGVMGIVGAVGSIGTMVSSIVGNFQFAGMNKSLDVIVQHTLQTTNIVRDTLLAANQWWPWLKANNDAIWSLRDTMLDPVTSTLERIVTAIGKLKFPEIPQLNVESMVSAISGPIDKLQGDIGKASDLIGQQSSVADNIAQQSLSAADGFWVKANNDWLSDFKGVAADPVNRIVSALRSLKIEGGIPVVINLDGKVLAQAVVRELKLAGA